MAGHCLWVLVWTGACYWHGVGGFMFNSSSSSLCRPLRPRRKRRATSRFSTSPAFCPPPCARWPGALDPRVLIGWPLPLALGFWSGRALATGTAWAGLCLIHHHHSKSSALLSFHITDVVIPYGMARAWAVPTRATSSALSSKWWRYNCN